MSSPGDLAILEGVSAITLESNGRSTWFIVTCISTGGPATTVIWTRDSDIITEGNETVLDDRVTAQYTHTLTVNEATSFNGTYTCQVSNAKSSYVVSDKIEATVIPNGSGNMLHCSQLHTAPTILLWFTCYFFIDSPYSVYT